MLIALRRRRNVTAEIREDEGARAARAGGGERGAAPAWGPLSWTIGAPVRAAQEITHLERKLARFSERMNAHIAGLSAAHAAALGRMSESFEVRGAAAVGRAGGAGSERGATTSTQARSRDKAEAEERAIRAAVQVRRRCPRARSRVHPLTCRGRKRRRPLFARRAAAAWAYRVSWCAGPLARRRVHPSRVRAWSNSVPARSTRNRACLPRRPPPRRPCPQQRAPLPPPQLLMVPQPALRARAACASCRRRAPIPRATLTGCAAAVRGSLPRDATALARAVQAASTADVTASTDNDDDQDDPDLSAAECVRPASAVHGGGRRDHTCMCVYVSLQVGRRARVCTRCGGAARGWRRRRVQRGGRGG